VSCYSQRILGYFDKRKCAKNKIFYMTYSLISKIITDYQLHNPQRF
jgi:hypothetical protein